MQIGDHEGSPAAWNANLYDAKHDFVWKYGSDVVSLLAPQPGERILDLGCGTGHLTAQIAEVGRRSLGVDRSAEMVAAARSFISEFEIRDGGRAELTVSQRIRCGIFECRAALDS